MSWFTQTWFVQGLLHPLQTPSQLLLMLGLALLLGQQKHVKALFLLPFTVLVGFLLNHYGLLEWNTELILLVLALIAGLLLLLRLNLPLVLSLVLLVLSGVILGLDSSPIMIPGLGINSIISWRLGAVITMIVGISILSVISAFLENYWKGIILRVAGSWIATSAIFVLTLMSAGL